MSTTNPHLFPNMHFQRAELARKAAGFLFLISCLICLFFGLTIGLAFGLYLASAPY